MTEHGENDAHRDSVRQKAASYLALFTSTGTLLCCAIPSAIAAVAGGAAVVSFVSTFPWLVEISRYKSWIFLVAGIMVALSGILVYRPKSRVACSITGGRGCRVAGGLTKMIFWASVAFLTTGAFFAYALVPILRLIES